MLRLSLLVTLLIFAITANSTSIRVVINSNEDQLDFTENNEDLALPLKNDIFIYLKSLRQIIDFCMRRKVYLDLNLSYGLFLVNVNLKSALSKFRKNLPKAISKYVTKLIDDNDDLSGFFEFMVEQNHKPRDRYYKKISTLFTNASVWIRSLRGFDAKLIKPSETLSLSRFERRGVTGKNYLKAADRMNKWVPAPDLSDMCMASLANNRVYNENPLPMCKVKSHCYNMLLNGTNFGYALSHRLLYLINAKHARGCILLSVERDKKLKRRFCKLGYDEIKFNVVIGYKEIDLILQFMALCALDGHAQFLRRDWLHGSMRFQTRHGCFGMHLPDRSDVTLRMPKASGTWKLSKGINNQNILNGTCNSHVTSVAAATLSGVVRYILETYYS